MYWVFLGTPQIHESRICGLIYLQFTNFLPPPRVQISYLSLVAALLFQMTAANEWQTLRGSKQPSNPHPVSIASFPTPPPSLLPVSLCRQHRGCTDRARHRRWCQITKQAATGANRQHLQHLHNLHNRSKQTAFAQLREFVNHFLYDSLVSVVLEAAGTNPCGYRDGGQGTGTDTYISERHTVLRLYNHLGSLVQVFFSLNNRRWILPI